MLCAHPSEFLELSTLVFSPFKEELLDVTSEALGCFTSNGEAPSKGLVLVPTVTTVLCKFEEGVFGPKLVLEFSDPKTWSAALALDPRSAAVPVLETEEALFLE